MLICSDYTAATVAADFASLAGGLLSLLPWIRKPVHH